MKKILCAALALTFVLTGCSQVVETTTKVDTKPVDIGTEISSNIDINKEVIEYTKDDKIIQELHKQDEYLGKEINYTLYPTKEYNIPEYVNVDGELKTVYLPEYYKSFPEITTPITPEKDTAVIHQNRNADILLALEEQFGVFSGYSLVPTNKYVYGVTVKLPDGSDITVYIAERPTVDNFSIQMNVDEGLEIFGIGYSDSNSSIGSFLPSFSLGYAADTGMTNTSEYNEVIESGFLSVKNSPLSTFAADVDTASYTNLRGTIRDFMKTEYKYDISDEMHDVRIEEMLNYFSYNYENKTDEPFAINAEISKTPWNEDTQLLVLNITSKDLPKEKNEGSNLVFLIDTSGSMDSPDKLPLVKESLNLLVNELTEKDTISIVTYSGSEGTLIDGAKGDEKSRIHSAINSLSAYGSTNGEGGLKAAYKIAAKYQESHSNSRIIMCSDGDLNVGISSESELEKFVTKNKESGIYLSVLGFGNGNYKDNKMEILADKGNGNYFYIDSIKEGYKVLVEDMMSTLVTIADDVKFQVEFNPEYIKGYRKIGYENRDMADEDFNDDTKDGGEVGYGHTVTIVYEIVPIDSKFEISSSDLKYQKTSSSSDSDELLTVSIRYKDHGKNTSNLLEGAITTENYTDTPSKNWKFISNVVEFGLIINESNYKGTADINNVIESLEELSLTDKDKAEFLAIVYGYQSYLNHYGK